MAPNINTIYELFDALDTPMNTNSTAAVERALRDSADVPAELFVFKTFDLRYLLLVDRKYPGL